MLQVEPITRIEVMGKSADQVVEEVLEKVGTSSGDKTGKVSSVERGKVVRKRNGAIDCWYWCDWRGVCTGDNDIVSDNGIAGVSALQLIVFQGLSGTGKGTTTAKLRVGPLCRVMSRDRAVHAVNGGCGKHCGVHG